MINPNSITNFNLDTPQLEETILWWILAAGKNGITAAKCLDKFLVDFSCVPALSTSADQLGKATRLSPFETVRYVDKSFDLSLEMKSRGIGCYNNKSKSWRDLVNSNINLKTCSLEQLESIKGIGPKTARCFLMHSRRGQKLAGLDTHVLKFLKLLGYKVPSSTPTGQSYVRLEKEFINLAESIGKTTHEVDLIIWNYFSSKKKSGVQEMKNILSLLSYKEVLA